MRVDFNVPQECRQRSACKRLANSVGLEFRCSLRVVWSIGIPCVHIQILALCNDELQFLDAIWCYKSSPKPSSWRTRPIPPRSPTLSELTVLCPPSRRPDDRSSLCFWVFHMFWFLHVILFAAGVWVVFWFRSWRRVPSPLCWHLTLADLMEASWLVWSCFSMPMDSYGWLRSQFGNMLVVLVYMSILIWLSYIHLHSINVGISFWQL